jgi:predicted component of type VI protein secretion system
MTVASRFPIVSEGTFFPVDWNEGMLLMPHHLQQQDEMWWKTFGYHLHIMNPFHWGVLKCEWDAYALLCGKIVFQTIEAVFPKGHIFFFPHIFYESLSLDLKSLKKDVLEWPQKICLKMLQTASGNLIYKDMQELGVCDRRTHDNPIMIPRRVPAVALTLRQDQPQSSELCIPLLEVTYENQSFQITPYQPPQIFISKESSIGLLCYDLSQKIRESIVLIQKKIRSDGSASLTEYLRCLYAGLIPFETVFKAPFPTPYELFLSLGHLAGLCAGFGNATDLPIFDGYDHQNLLNNFQQMIRFIISNLNTFKSLNEYIDFTSFEEGFFLNLEENTVFSKKILNAYQDNPHTKTISQMVLGVECAVGNEKQVLNWMENAIIASTSFIKNAVNSRTLGMQRQFKQNYLIKDSLCSHETIEIILNLSDPFFVPSEKLFIVNHNKEGSTTPSRIFLLMNASVF